jgi:hypothetical protein
VDTHTHTHTHTHTGVDRVLGGELNAVVCAASTFSDVHSPKCIVDQPLDARFTMGTGMSAYTLCLNLIPVPNPCA